MTDISRTELCQWLRDNSSGVYRHAADAADEIEMLAQLANQHFARAMANGEEVRRLREENERLRKDAERLDDLDTIAQRRESPDMHLCNGYISLYLRTSIGNTHGIRRKDIRAAIDAARGAK